MYNNPRMAVETTRELFHILVDAGANRERLLQMSGIDYEELQSSEQRFPVSSHLKLWQAAQVVLPGAGLGLSMGAKSNPHNRGIVGLVFAASPDLRTAIHNKIRYTKILADHISLQHTEADESCSVQYFIQSGYFHHYEIERVFAGFLNWVRTYVRQFVAPQSLSFQYPQVSYDQDYKKHFACPLHFEQVNNVISLPSKLLNIRNSNYNDYLYTILKARAEDVLSQLDVKEDFVTVVRDMIASRLSSDGVAAESIASAMNISTRTFYRKLKDEQVNYQNLLDEVRKEMALSYLQREGYKVHTVSCLLGYSDSRSFNRAFQRWFGCTPRFYIQNYKL